MVFNATFNNISVISWQSVFIGGGNWKYLEKTTDLPQVTDKTLSHNIVSITRRLSEIQTRNVSSEILKISLASWATVW